MGENLFFHELGLVLQLKQGDVIAFRSDILTHYNLHYSGKRGSLVVHSDKHLDKWKKAKKGFGKHAS